MGTRTSRTAYPIRGATQGAAIGTWGAWLTMAVLLTALSGLVVSAIYLYWGQQEWPPAGFDEPAIGLGALALVLCLGAAGLTYAAIPVLRGGGARTSGHLIFGGLLLGGGSLTALVVDLVTAPWGWDEHVYTSLFWILVGNAAVFVAVAALMSVAVLVQHTAGVLDAGRHLELEVTVVFWGFAVATVASAFALVHLLPHR
jgi:heme/copper-type cytochrome/quinol oxidase subunit 3